MNRSEGLFDQSFSVALPIQAIKGFPCLGSFCCSAHQAHRGVPLAAVLLCRMVCQALKRAPWMGSYSVVQCVRRLFDGPASLLFSYPHWYVEREAMVMAPPPMHDLAVSPCFHGCPAFLHRNFPLQSPLSHPLHLSLCNQQQPSPRNCSTIPKLQLLPTVPSRGPAFLSRVCMAVARTF